MRSKYRIEVLSGDHDRTTFSSGIAPLDGYLRHQAGQDVRRRAAACYVAVDATTSVIAGYYTLAAGSVVLGALPDHLVKRLPRYPSVPVARLGRLAVDQSHRGRGLGGALLWDAVARSMASEVAVYALAVDAKDDTAKAFYVHHGFMSLASAPMQLVLPLTNLGARR